METTRNVQTAFRFKKELVLRMKSKARMKKMSLNAYVENVIERDLNENGNTYEALMDSIGKLRLSDCEPVQGPGLKVSEEDVRNDERMQYILGK